MLLLIIVAALVLLYLAALYKYNYSKANKGITHLGGWIPFMGHVMEFAPNPFAFVKKNQSKHGDCFSLTIMNKKLIIMTNVHDANYFIFNKEYTIDNLVENTSMQSFGIRKQTLDAQDGEASRQAFKHIHMYLQQPEDLNDITKRAQEQFERFFLHSRNANWQKGKLFEFISDSIFSAALAALVGEDYFDFNDMTMLRQLKQDYFDFDKQRNVLETDLPAFAKTKAKAAREKFAAHFRKPFSNKASNLFQARYQLYKEHAEGPEEMGRIMSLIVWVAMANTIPAGFWTIAHLIKNQAAYKEVVDELNEIVSAVPKSSDKKGPLPWFTQDMLNNMKKLHSTVDEALRYYSSVIIARTCIKDTTVTLHSGQKIELRAGDDIHCCVERIAYDSLLFENAAEFQWDRFYNRKTFTRAGRDLGFNQVFLTFGGGSHKCPGRFFALNEIKILVALILVCFELKLLDKELPKPAYHEFSGGLLCPNGDVSVEYKLKDVFA